MTTITPTESLTVAVQRTESRWYYFDLFSAEGAAGGWGRVLAPSPASAWRFASCFLAGTSRVQLRAEASDA